MTFIRVAPLFIVLVLLSSCEGMGGKKVSSTLPPSTYEPSARALINASQSDKLFAQAALNKLGYQVGRVDGIWGPKSARAIRHFEKQNKLQSANGHLSELNLNTLESVGSLKRSEQLSANPYRPKSISSQINKSVPLEDAPQLIILKQTYSVYSKPNPYSKIISTVDIGAGIYVLRLDNGWYEVEVKNNLHGYIKAI